MPIMKEIVYIVEDDFDIGELAQYLIVNLGKEARVLSTIAAFNRQINVLWLTRRARRMARYGSLFGSPILNRRYCGIWEYTA